MSEIAPSIKIDLAEKLKDRGYRRLFFLAEASAKIAEQIIKLRKKRGLTQGQVAKMVGTGQPAISRAERADYQNWSFRTLRDIADALDGRIRVTIEASEDVLGEYGAAGKVGAADKSIKQTGGEAFSRRYSVKNGPVDRSEPPSWRAFESASSDQRTPN